MRIVILSDTLIADGGAEILSRAMARGMAERGLNVSFIVADDSTDPELVAAGVKIENIGVSRINPAAGVGALVPALFNPKVRDYVARYVRENDGPDVAYHVHAWSKALSPSLFAGLSPVASRTFVHAHDFFLVCPNANFFNFTTDAPCGQTPLTMGCIMASCSKRHAVDKAWRVTRGGLLRTAMKPSEPWNLLLIHEDMRRRFLDAGFDNSRIFAVPNPSNPLTEPIDAASNRTFLFLGRLVAEKGPDIACAAAEEAGVDLLVVGDGELRYDLEKRFKKARFLGWLTKDTLRPIAALCRAVLMTSRAPEPFGLVAAEALGSGLPVVASDTALLAADIQRRGCGRAVNPRDISAVAATLRELDRDDAAVRAMSEAALSAYRHISPSTDAWIDGILGHYQAAIDAQVQKLAAE